MVVASMELVGCGRDLYDSHPRDASLDVDLDAGVADAYVSDAGPIDARVPSRDPLSVDWMFTIDPQREGRLGGTVAAAGDVNRDGFDDVLVAASLWDGALADEGRVYLLLGGPDGLDASRIRTFDLTEQGDSHFGASAVGIGDLDDDEFDDVAIGAPRFDIPGGSGNEGRVYVLRGTPDGLEPWFHIDGPPRINSDFGNPIVSADIDGDEREDLVVGASNFNDAEYGEGRVFVYLADGDTDRFLPLQELDAVDQLGAAFGFAIGCVDVDGDGDDDCLIDAYSWGRPDSGVATEVEGEGRTYFYRSDGARLEAAPRWTNDPFDSMLGHYGGSIAAVDDVTGDGLGDIVVGSWAFDGAFEDQGVAHLHVGSRDGLVQAPAVTFDSPGPYRAALGYTVAGRGDFDADGHADLIVAGYGLRMTGGFAIYRGSAAGLIETPAWESEPIDQAGAQLSSSIAFVGDVNGDDHDDVVAGAYLWEGTAYRQGAIYAYYGR